MRRHWFSGARLCTLSEVPPSKRLEQAESRLHEALNGGRARRRHWRRRLEAHTRLDTDATRMEIDRHHRLESTRP
jgi:hypothetical protein